MQVGKPTEEDLRNWGHHGSPSTVPDAIMQHIEASHPGVVSFVFSCQACLLPIYVPMQP